MQLINDLDVVRRDSALPRSLIKLAQALDTLDPSGPAFRKCLRELSSICDARGILPPSCTISPHLLNISPNQSSRGPHGDSYAGTLDGSRVWVKRVLLYVEDDPQKTTKVRSTAFAFPSVSLFAITDGTHSPPAKPPWCGNT